MHSLGALAEGRFQPASEIQMSVYVHMHVYRLMIHVTTVYELSWHFKLQNDRMLLKSWDCPEASAGENGPSTL